MYYALRITSPGGALTALEHFSAPVRAWFEATFGRPTRAQELGWPAIQRGEHTLILSPTGSGKTLAAFLWAIDRLFTEAAAQGAPKGVRLLYISPLKALNNDIERNLRVPLAGVREAAVAQGIALPELRVAVRTGDTPGHVRLGMVKKPPHILITTPESLYLILTSTQARQMLRTVRTVIVDEIHTVAGNKRGVHLALSLERLAHLADGGPVQRIGLSATQRPLEEVARFLGGQEWQGEGDARSLAPRPVAIVDAGLQKSIELQVRTVVNDFRALGGSVWPAIEAQVADEIRAHRTTLVFCNGRRQAERIAGHLSQEQGLPGIRAHHGSMSREARFQMEGDLKEGKLPALVGTSSLELGIDIGSVDLVVQVQSPKGVARGLQRVGRSGHLVGQTSVGHIYATHREDLMEAAAVAGAMLRGEVEPTHVPENCLDVLAQQIVAMVSVEDWSASALYDLVRQSAPYKDLPLSAYHEVLAMLSGKYPREAFRELRARLDWDRAADKLSALPGSRFLATLNGGTIADRGAFGAYLKDGKTRIGELDEEFVFERRVGDVFTLGTHSWRIVQITDDRVILDDGSGGLPMVPFWKGDIAWRDYDLGVTVGRFRRQVAERINDPRAAQWLRENFCLDENSAQNVLHYVRDQLEASGAISSDRTVLVELFSDPVGDRRIVVHSPFGGRVNAAWALALTSAFRERTHTTPEVRTNDDGILLRFPDADRDPPLDLVTQMPPEEARERILAELPDSALFGAQFRQNAARALLMPRSKGRHRTPFWLQRLKAKDLLATTRQFDRFPILVETYRDCLREVLDLEHLLEVLGGIREGRIAVVASERAVPSPAAMSLLYDFVGIYMYEWDQPKAERQLQALAVNRDLLQDLLKDVSLADLIKPEAVAQVESHLQHAAPDRRARSANELLVVLRDLGDLSTEELFTRALAEGPQWLAEISAAGRIIERQIPTSGGPVQRWVLAEEAGTYARAFGADPIGGSGLRPAPTGAIEPDLIDRARVALLQRLLASRGPLTLAEITARYAFPEDWLRATLAAWSEEGRLAHGRLVGTGGEEQWCDRRNLEQVHRRTLTLLRREIQPVPLPSYADFLFRWQHIHPDARLPQADGVRRALQQLRALPAPALLWERDLLPARVHGFRPGELDALCQSGELAWVGLGTGRPAHLRARFLFRGEGASYLAGRDLSGLSEPLSEPAQKVLACLRSEGACFTRDLELGVQLRGEALAGALVELVARGLITNDALRALHELVHFRPATGTQERRPFSSLEAQLAERLGPRERPLNPRERLPGRMREARRVAAHRALATAQWVGRWSLVQRMGFWGADVAPEEQLARWARQLLSRYGIVSRECLLREDIPWAWDTLYEYLQALEMRGEVRRGYFVQGLGGAQFALPEAVERLREAHARQTAGDESLVVVNAWDPTWFVGGLLCEGLHAADGSPLALARNPASYAVLQRGRPLLFLERRGKAITVPVGVEEGLLISALRAANAAITGRLGRRRLSVETWNGAPILGSPGQSILETLGAYPHPPVLEWPSL